jgi:sugar fermentation stimulation protein A
VKLQSKLVEGRLVRRYKRFLADVRLGDGTVVTAHCPNPGSMQSCMEVGGRVWLSRSERITRKLAHTWEISEVRRVRIFVNPLRSNDIVAEAIERGQVPELGGYATVVREVAVGRGSRIDLLLESATAGCCYVEIKSATLGLGAGRAAFPDSVTERGTRHLGELVRLRRRGHRAVLFFCVNRADATSVEPAEHIDPVYARALRRAASAGVELLAYRTRVRLDGVTLAGRVPVLL